MAITINTGFTNEQRGEIAAGLTKVLADSYAVYLKTHGYHWNVRGPNFGALHALFMDKYTEMWGALDLIAERIRALMFVFEDLAKLDPGGIQTLLRAVPPAAGPGAFQAVAGSAARSGDRALAAAALVQAGDLAAAEATVRQGLCEALDPMDLTVWQPLPWVASPRSSWCEWSLRGAPGRPRREWPSGSPSTPAVWPDATGPLPSNA